MTDAAGVAVPGPVEFALLEFPIESFDGRIVDELADLASRKVISIVDLVMVRKSDDGTLDVVEVTDVTGDLADRIGSLPGEVMWLLSAGDVTEAAEAMAPGTTGVLIVWENTWARNFRVAVTDAGGRLVIHDRLDSEEVAAAMESQQGA